LELEKKIEIKSTAGNAKLGEYDIFITRKINKKVMG